MLSSVNEAIAGLATIRAFNIGPWLIARNRDLVDKNAATSLLNQSLNRWLSVRLEGLGEFMSAALHCTARTVLEVSCCSSGGCQASITMCPAPHKAALCS